MRKRKLIEENARLFKRIDELKKQVTDLKEQLEKSNKKIEEITVNQTASQTKNEQPIENLKDTVIVSSPDFNAEEYGAKAIGKIVVAASKITSDPAMNQKAGAIETVNLILGKAEVSKAEILKIVSSEADEKEKKINIDNIVQKSCDYFTKSAENN